MNVRKFFAGMTTAALAASMLSMVSFAEETESVAAPQIAAQFYVQAYDGDSWAWNTWKATEGTEDGFTLALSGDAAALADDAIADGVTNGGLDESEVTLAGSGVQLFLRNADAYTIGTTITGKFKLNIECESNPTENESDMVEFDKPIEGELKFEVVKGQWNGGLPEATQTVELFGDSVSWAKLDSMGKFSISGEFTDVEVTMAEPEPEPEPIESDYNVADVVTNSKYAGDWAADGQYSPDFDHIVAEDGMLVTVKYSLDTSKDWAQNVFAPMDQHNWVKLGDEFEFSQDGWVVDPSITRATAEDGTDEFNQQRDSAPGPFMKKDGFIMVKEDGELSFFLDEGMINELKANAEANPGKDETTGENVTWYGLGFQVYGVILDQVTYEYNVEGVESPKKFNINEGVSFNNSVTINPADHGVRDDSGFSKIKIGLTGISLEDKGIAEGEGSAWNDWCTYKIKITKANGDVSYVAVVGAQVGWDVTVDEGDPDNDDDNVVVAVADATKTDATGKVEVELPYENGTTYEVIALCWDSFPDDPYINVVGVAFDDEEIDWPAEPGNEDSSEDESSQDESSQDESSKEESSKDESTASKPGNSGNNGGKNANTGAVALGLGVLALAGAAVVVTKKKF